ncbi:threonine--tRNA ligase [Ureaplasma ceti]|uniref:Threonine--tRNA ligase n=1 Tax=Ureaplasma ceti TaxID=3119530 RepID=A0ABP9U9N0_9BACT
MKFDHALNHSAAHILAAALKKLYPDVKLTIGPAIEEGFYYDFSTSTPVSINDLPKIEKQMKKIVSGAHEFTKSVVSKQEALDFYKDNKYKSEIISEIPDEEEITFYTCGDFTDLCAGPHTANTKNVKAIKLLNLAGSYWRGDSKNDQLTRIYGVAFDNEADLAEYLTLLEDRKQRDHRKIGKDLKLFTFSPLVGQGLPIWLPAGTKIKYEIQRYINYLQHKYEFEPVMTPVLGTVDLYKTSGHWDHYKENMFPVMDVEGEELVLRPMTCPHHIMVYKSDLRSYRQMPIRLCEHSNLHRYEASGGLTGLERVREMVLEDTHIFCRPSQIKEEVARCYKAIVEAHEGLGSKIWRVDFSTYDPEDTEKFHGDTAMWESSQAQLREALEEQGLEYVVMPGEAAFYGPKIDFQVKTALGHVVTVSTIQLDFLLPERFELEYKNEKGEMERPVMVHLGIIGTYERYLAMLLEQTKGVLPLWLSPTQIEILPVNVDIHAEYSHELMNKLNLAGFRVEVDDRDERLAKRLREAQISKVPYQLIIGDNESKDSNNISFRRYGSEETVTMSYEEFVDMLNKQISERK